MTHQDEATHQPAAKNWRSVITYRHFENFDPPKLLALWNACNLGRGAAKHISCDVFEMLNYSQPYFEHQSIIVAEEADNIVGYVHTGLAPNEERNGLDATHGIISALMVHPVHRRQKLGTELMRRAEGQLIEHGAKKITAGPAENQAPYYVGIYGGARPSGFLKSDPLAEPFLMSQGYHAAEEYGIYQRDLMNRKDPISFRLVTLRRKMELRIVNHPKDARWWWFTRFGRLDSIRFQLWQKGGDSHVAGVTVIGMDTFLPSWNERCIALCDLIVQEDCRSKGYGQLLITEVMRRLREELIQRVEIHVNLTNKKAVSLIDICGFERVDTGVVYRKQLS